MTQTYFPFDSGSGANVTESQWSQMAQNWIATGVIKGALNELLVYGDSTGMQVKVKSGQAWMKGHFFQSDAEVILAIGTASSVNPRIDRVIIRVDWTANTIALAVLQGTPAVSPTPPALTQNVSRWEISLAQINVGKSVSTIASGNIADERPFAIPQGYFPGWTNLPLFTASGWSNYGGSMETCQYYVDAEGFVNVKGAATGGVGGSWVVLMPVGLRPNAAQKFLCAAGNNTGVAAISCNPDGSWVIDATPTTYVDLSPIRYKAAK
jgi:hypothetical protein